MKTPDIIVIGAGAAGVAAAHAARKSGAEVLLVAAQTGATRLASGFFDVADDPIGKKNQLKNRELVLAHNIQAVLDTNPRHPYHFFQGAGALQAITDFIADFQRSGSDLFFGDGEHNATFLTAFGTTKNSAFYPRSWHGARLDQLSGKRTLLMELVGYPGLRGWFLRQALENLVQNPGATEWATAALQIRGLAQESFGIRIAHALDRGGSTDELVRTVTAVIADRGPFDCIGFPPVLGLEAHATVVATLLERLGCPVFEIPDSQSRIPGERLHRALQRLLVNDGIRTISVRISGLTFGNGCISEIMYKDSSGGDGRLPVTNLILATGKYIGNNHRLDDQGILRDKLTGLPFICLERTVAVMDHDLFFQSRATARQPILSAGLRVDPMQRALAEDGSVIGNLYIAGELLGGYDPCEGEGGLGVAVATGTNAVRNIVRNA